MQAVDVMTQNVVSVQASTEVRDVAKLLLKHKISAVPVVDANHHIIGIVSEGDLMRRTENDTEDRHSWWLAALLSPSEGPAEYIKSHGRKASDVMTRKVITVAEGAPLNEVASLLESQHVKRVPVVRDGKLVGIVSRANLPHGLAAAGSAAEGAAPTSDRELREKVMREVEKAIGVDAPLVNATVENGAVELWGVAYSALNKKAAQVAAESTAGVTSVANNIGIVPAWIAAN